MELARLLHRLWARKATLVVFLILAVVAGFFSAWRLDVSPFKVESRGVEYGSARTEVVVDRPRSALADVNGEIAPLASRALLFAEATKSAEVREFIAQRAGVAPEMIAIETDIGMDQPLAVTVPNSAERASSLTGESRGMRVVVTATADIPILTIYAEAADAARATSLADSAANGLIAYQRSVEGARPVPASSQVVLRQLGQARGGLVNEGGTASTAVLVAFGVFALLTVVMLIVTGLRNQWRLLDAPHDTTVSAASSAEDTEPVIAEVPASAPKLGTRRARKG